METASTSDDSKMADFFDMMKIKQSYPKVKINLLGNLHQEKVIYVIEEDQDGNMQVEIPKEQNLEEINENGDENIEIAGAKQQQNTRTVKEVLEQSNIFEIEMQVESDVEGGIDIENDCIYGYL